MTVLSQPMAFLAGAAGSSLSVTLDGQSNDAASSSTYVYTVANTIPAGSLCMGFAGSGAVTLNSVVDSKGNTWAVDRTTAGTSTGAHIARSVLGTALIVGDTITFTFSSSTNGHGAIVAYVVNQGASPFDKNATSSATTNSPTATTAATTFGNEIVFGVVANQIATVTEDAAYTTLADITYQSGNRRVHVAYKIVAVTGAQTYNPTQSSSQPTAESMATYKGQ